MPSAGGCLGGCQAAAAWGAGRAPWDPYLLALLLTLLQEQLTALELGPEQLLSGDGEEEAPEVQASDDVEPHGAALAVVAAGAVGVVQPDNLDARERGLGRGCGFEGDLGSEAAGGAGGLTSGGCHARMLCRSCCFLNFTCYRDTGGAEDPS